MMLPQTTRNDNCKQGLGLFRDRGRARLDRPTSRRGAALVLTALMMVAMIGVLAFAVDLGYVMHVQTELQRTADACSLAAAAKLPDESEATVTAHSVAAENGWSSGVDMSEGDEMHGSDLDPLDVEIGYWDRDTATFATPTPYGNSPNAARVTLRRTHATGNPLGLFFGRIFGKSQANSSASSTAMYDHWLCGPFVGIDWLSVPGSPQTDSYNSEEGPYDWHSARDRGSICSDGPINVDGAAIIRGDARAGKGHSVSITGGATVTRSIGSRRKPLEMPPVDTSEAALENDNDQIPLIPQGHSWISPVDADGNFLLDGNKVIDLPSGTYYFNNFTVTGQAQFSVSGPTTIYITGNLERSGGAVVANPTNTPANLKFLMSGGTANVTSTNDLYGLIYAPNTAVTIDGNSDFFGAVVGKTLTITGSGAAHYDESLGLDEIEFPRRTALVD